jgi:DNA repair exonuclease SbcCD nuclease subunit
MSKPIAVLISDVHYNIQTLLLADAAMRQAINKANELKIPLIVAGDLHDTKANLRGECVNAILKIFENIQECYILRGNHDAIHEKSVEHSLNFLKEPCCVITSPTRLELALGIYCIPYYHDANELRKYIKTIPIGSILIMHQGLQSSNMGDYIQDKSAITKEDVIGMRVLSGHYHARQTIELSKKGKWDYIGNPYSLSFGEVFDLEKGFQILYSDGSLEFVPTNLRKHVIIEIKDGQIYSSSNSQPKLGDLIWVKCLTKHTREQVSEITKIKDFKLTYELNEIKKQDKLKNNTQTEMLDAFIETQNISNDQKLRLKQIWKELCE